MMKKVVRKALCFMFATVMLLTMIFPTVIADEGTKNIAVMDAIDINNIIMIDDIMDSGSVMSISATEDDVVFLNGINVTAEVDTATQWGVGTNYDNDFYESIERNYAETNSFVISSAGELAAISKFVNDGKGNFSGKIISLKSDLSLGGSGIVYAKSKPNADNEYELTISGITQNAWTPIGNASFSFNGIFDGGGYEITEMIVLEKSSPTTYAGLFGHVNGGEIQNIGIGKESHVIASSSSAYAGGIAGYTTGVGSIYNCYNTGDVSAASTTSSPDNSYVYAGGIVGSDNGSISECYNTGIVSAASSFSRAYVGGIVGDYRGSISECYNTGIISAASTYSSACAGGIVGYNFNGSISYCYNTGIVSAASTYSSQSANAGGIAGYTYNGSISYCYNTAANVSAVAYNVYACAGGIVGYNYNGSISYCYNTAANASASSIYSPAYAGGIVGYNNNGNISYCYNIGVVSSISYNINAFAGGIVSANYNGSINNCFYDSSVQITPAPTDEDSKVVGLATSMKFSNYKTDHLGRDIFANSENVWYFYPDDTEIHPELLWAMKGPITPAPSLNIIVTPSTVVATLAANLPIQVTGENLDGEQIVFSIKDIDGITIFASEPVAASNNFTHLLSLTSAQMNIPIGTYTILAEVVGKTVTANASIYFTAYNPLWWESSLLESSYNGTASLEFRFAADEPSRTIGSVYVNNTLRTDAVYEGNSVFIPGTNPTGNVTVKIMNVRYPLYFPSFSFTFS